MKRLSLWALLSMLLPACAPRSALETSMSSSARPTQLVTFDPSNGEHPENVVMTPDGTLYVTLHQGASVWRQRRSKPGERLTLPVDGVKSADTRINGLVARRDGEILVAVRSNNTEIAGVWRLKAGHFQKFASLPAGAGLNGMADDGQFLYVADDTAGRLYRVTSQGKSEVWIEDARLAPQGQSPNGFPVYGANGVKVHGSEVYVSNSSTGTVWRTPTTREGLPGPLSAFLPAVHFHNIDDFAFDQQGNFYFATVVDQTVERVSPQGEVTVLLRRGDGLDMPTAVAFGATAATRSTLFVISGSFYSPPGTTPNANVLRFEGDQPGEPTLR